MSDPIFIDLGRHKRRLLKQLERGRGRLHDELQAALADVRAGLTSEDADRRFVPVVVIYRLKKKRPKGLLG
jgi:hypothetical protein